MSDEPKEGIIAIESPIGLIEPMHRIVTIHGTACHAEFTDPKPVDAIFYRGWGTVVRSDDQLVWVHIPLVTAAELPGAITSPQLPGNVITGISVSFVADSAVEVRHVHLWDGRSRFFVWDGGPTPGGLTIAPTLVTWTGGHAFQRSVGASLGVQFPATIDGPVQPTAFTVFAASASYD
jgi:hypothetical protein